MPPNMGCPLPVGTSVGRELPEREPEGRPSIGTLGHPMPEETSLGGVRRYVPTGRVVSSPQSRQLWPLSSGLGAKASWIGGFADSIDEGARRATVHRRPAPGSLERDARACVRVDVCARRRVRDACAMCVRWVLASWDLAGKQGYPGTAQRGFQFKFAGWLVHQMVLARGCARTYGTAPVSIFLQVLEHLT